MIFNNFLKYHAAERNRFLTKNGGPAVEHRNLVLASEAVITEGVSDVPSSTFMGTDQAVIARLDARTISITITNSGNVLSCGIYRLITQEEVWEIWNQRLITGNDTFLPPSVLTMLDTTMSYSGLGASNEVCLCVGGYKPNTIAMWPELSEEERKLVFKIKDLTPASNWAQTSLFSGLLNQDDNVIVNILNVKVGAVIASAIAPAILYKLHKKLNDRALEAWTSGFGVDNVGPAFTGYINQIVTSMTAANSPVKPAFLQFSSNPNGVNGFAFVQSIEAQINKNILASYQF